MAYAPPPPAVVPVSGFALPPFEPLADIFGRVVAQQPGGGAALSIRHEGRLVVDLYGGTYAEDSLQLLFSVSKAVTAIAASLASADGALDLDEPVAGYWPAFARRSTAAITPRLVLSHRSGLASLDRALSLDDLVAGVDEEVIETQEPYWEPGTAHGYHAFTYGTLMNCIFRRVLGVSVGEFVAERISGPLGLDLWIGTPESQLGRIHPIEYSAPRITQGRAEFVAASPIPAATTGRLASTTDIYNSPEMHRGDWPSTSGVGSARALCALFAATLDGTIMSTDARHSMIATQAIGPDRVLGIPMHYGSGMQLPFPQLPMLGAGSYGHEAAGGSLAFASEEHGIALGYTTSVFPPMGGASYGSLAMLASLRHCLDSAR